MSYHNLVDPDITPDSLSMFLFVSLFLSLSFLDASSHLYMRPCPSVRWSVGRLVGNAFVQIDENGHLRILNDLDNAGRGRKRDKEEGGTRRKEGRGGRRDEE